jgi:hypothetical protein
VQQAAAAVTPYRPPEYVAQRAEVAAPDMLEHPDRDKRVETADGGPVVVLDEFDTIREALTRCSLACVDDLLVRDVERRKVYTMMSRHMQGQRAPAASRFENPTRRLQVQCLSNMAETAIGAVDARNTCCWTFRRDVCVS